MFTRALCSHFFVWCCGHRHRYISGAGDPRCELMIVMGKTNPSEHMYVCRCMYSSGLCCVVLCMYSSGLCCVMCVLVVGCVVLCVYSSFVLCCVCTRRLCCVVYVLVWVVLWYVCTRRGLCCVVCVLVVGCVVLCVYSVCCVVYVLVVVLCCDDLQCAFARMLGMCVCSTCVVIFRPHGI